jgi:hypothetical protein
MRWPEAVRARTTADARDRVLKEEGGLLREKQARGDVLPEPEVKSYEYSDMRPFFNNG